ncbi:MBL fold metallo-hydrolase [Cellulomonas sp. APG4]|uniref:MBL fold metallo-hydrolase n=1 Tax=Cellulomonas sp. APG4 TaxID=1538656 RepID=UPI001379FD5A|nr:MBL fold metallo-hydrolase [Cellulomonas sp. APG4]NCT89786.1 MBL fold metallo-hydrolase [Cellulomonas sp. APG4]
MTYDGDREGGGGHRRLDELDVRKLTVGTMGNATYLLTARAGGEQLLIDAAAEPARLLALLREGSPTARLDVVLTTHRHSDHHGALESIHAVTGARHVCGAGDADHVPVRPDRRLHHGDVLTLGHVTFDVVALRGHTPGSVALAYREPRHAVAPDAVPGRVHLFTGDSLFPGGAGRTTSSADFASLMRDLETRVFDVYDDRTWVYPGHGRDTTLGAERPHLAQWWARGW